MAMPGHGYGFGAYLRRRIRLRSRNRLNSCGRVTVSSECNSPLAIRSVTFNRCGVTCGTRGPKSLCSTQIRVWIARNELAEMSTNPVVLRGRCASHSARRLEKRRSQRTRADWSEKRTLIVMLPSMRIHFLISTVNTPSRMNGSPERMVRASLSDAARRIDMPPTVPGAAS